MLPMTPNTCPRNPERPASGRVGNEHGAALILAIIMLVVLSLLGSVVLISSDTEMKVTGNYQVAKQTFWVADRAVEYATSRDMLMTMGTSVNLVTDGGGVHKSRIEAAGGGFLTEGSITDLGAGALPTSLAASYGSDFGANYYQISVTARQKPDVVGQTNTSAAVHIDSTILRIYKNEDENIFITTGGG